MRTVFKWIGVLVIVLVGVGTALIIFFDGNWIKGYLASAASEQLSRRLSIEGDLEVQLSLRPYVSAEKIRLENALWSERTDMLELERLEFRIILAELLKGRVVIPEFVLTEPVLFLERSAQGERNWAFLEKLLEEIDGDGVPAVDKLDIHDGRVTYLDHLSDIEVTTTLAEARVVSKDVGKPVGVEGKGWFEDEPLQFTLSAAPLSKLLTADQPYPLTLAITLGETRGWLKGTLLDPLQLQDVDLKLVLRGTDPANLATILDIPLPSLPAYHVKTRLYREADAWVFEELEGTLGDHVLAGVITVDVESDPPVLHIDLSLGENDLSGEVTVDSRNERPFLRGHLASQQLDFNDLAAFINAASGPGESPEAVAYSEQILARLPDIEAMLSFQGQRVMTPRLALDDVAAEIELEGDRLALKPLNFAVAGGRVSADVQFEGRQRPSRSLIEAELQWIDLAEILVGFDIDPWVQGTLGGRGELSGTGSTIMEFLRSASGEVSIIVAGVQIDRAFVERLDIDTKDIPILDEEGPVPIHCGVATLRLQDGITRVEPLALDTTDAKITGTGAVDLHEERLDVTLTLYPTEPELLRLLGIQAVVEIAGPLPEPSISRDSPLVEERMAPALEELTGLLSTLVPLVVSDTGELGECQALSERLQGDTPFSRRFRQDRPRTP